MMQSLRKLIKCSKLIVKSINNFIGPLLTRMKINQTRALPAYLLEEASHIGKQIARLRIARHVTQAEAALRAGLSRNTAYRLEKGDPGLALGQILRYLDAISPGKTLLGLLQEDDPALITLGVRERTQRYRAMSPAELKKLDF